MSAYNALSWFAVGLIMVGLAGIVFVNWILGAFTAFVGTALLVGINQ